MDGAESIQWTGSTRDLMARINSEVNEAVEFLPDAEQSQMEDVWSYPDDCYGDCEDFALEKRRRLVLAGVPSASLTLAVTFHQTQLFPHAVLLVESDSGTWVLDDLSDRPMCWDAVPYVFTARERPDGTWVRFVQP